MFDIVCFGQQHWDHCWTGKQQILRRLAVAGHRILYVNPELEKERAGLHESVAAWREPERRLVTKRPFGNLWTMSTPTFAWGWNLSRARDAELVARTAHRLGFWRPFVFAIRPIDPKQLAELDALGFAYYAVDDIAAYHGMSGAAQERVRAEEQKSLEIADVVVGVSPALVSRFSKINSNTHLLENGSDTAHFAPAALARAPDHPLVKTMIGRRIGFFGQVDDRLDQDIIIKMATTHPDWQILLAGRIAKNVDFTRLHRFRNVHFLGYMEYKDLPSFAKHVDVWHLPYVHSPLTEACSPLKVYEYLATGRPVVAVPLSGLGATRKALVLAEGGSEFTAAVEAVLNDPARKAAERRAVARDNSWERRVEVLSGLCENARKRAASSRGLALSVLEAMPARHARRRLAPNQRSKRSLFRRILFESFWDVRAPSSRLLPPRLKNIRRVIVTPDVGLGDYLVSTPVLAAMRDAWPDVHISAMYEDVRNAGLWKSSGYVDALIRTDSFEHAGPLKRARIVFDGWRSKADAVVNLSLSGFPASALLIGGNRFFTLFDERFGDTFCGWVLPRKPGKHEAENRLRLLEVVLWNSLPQRELPPVQSSVRRVPGVEPVAQATAKYIVAHPGGARENRIYPPELFAQALAIILAELPNLRIVITGGHSERTLADAIVSNLAEEHRDRTRITAGTLAVDELTALISAAEAVLCIDTGVAHLARAANVPLVVLFGPEDHQRWGPYPRQVAPAIVLREQVPCAPCSRSTCSVLYCMRLLKPSAVAAAVLDLVGGRVNPPRVDERVTRWEWDDIGSAGFDIEAGPSYARPPNSFAPRRRHSDGEGASAM